MNQAFFRFYGALHDFLSSERRANPVAYNFEGSPSIKDSIEAIGVPHTEVEAILVNGQAVDFDCLLHDGDRALVYAFPLPPDVLAPVRLRPPLPAEACFILDTHLGKLAAYLRLLGLDTLYRNDYPDDELARISSEEQRILLTRDLGVLKRSVVTYGHFVRETAPLHQVVEVTRRFALFDALAPFRRCLRCNGLLQAVSRDAVRNRLPADTLAYYDEFRMCTSCARVYWPGSHYRRMQRLVEYVQAQRPGA